MSWSKDMVKLTAVRIAGTCKATPWLHFQLVLSMVCRHFRRCKSNAYFKIKHICFVKYIWWVQRLLVTKSVVHLSKCSLVQCSVHLSNVHLSNVHLSKCSLVQCSLVQCSRVTCPTHTPRYLDNNQLSALLMGIPTYIYIYTHTYTQVSEQQPTHRSAKCSPDGNPDISSTVTCQLDWQQAHVLPLLWRWQAAASCGRECDKAV
jgi:hypothetical protein